MMTVKWLLSVWLDSASFSTFWKEINPKTTQHEAQGHKEAILSGAVEDVDAVVDEVGDTVDPEEDMVPDEEVGTD